MAFDAVAKSLRVDRRLRSLSGDDVNCALTILNRAVKYLFQLSKTGQSRRAELARLRPKGLVDHINFGQETFSEY
jgi:hypothetical protein